VLSYCECKTPVVGQTHTRLQGVAEHPQQHSTV
jgi:hypothetical protein